MAYKLTIGGVDQTDAIRRGPEFQQPTFELERNVRSLLKFDVELEPSKDAEVISYAKDGTTKVVGGILAVRDPIEVPAGAPACSRCEVDGFEAYTDWCYWSKTYTSPVTLKQILTDVTADKLDDYGITLHPDQVDGPTFAASSDTPLTWTNRRVSDVLRDLKEASGYMDRIDPDKRLKFFEIGSETGPSLSEANGDFGSLTWRDSDKPRFNRVRAEFGPDGIGDTPITHTWDADGIATAFSLAGENVPASSVWPSAFVIGGTPYPAWPVGAAPGGNGIEWDPLTDGGTISFVGTETSLVSAPTTVAVTYLPQFPFTIEKGSGSPPRELLVKNQAITDYAFGDTTAETAQTRVDQDVRVITFTTLVDGIFPGQTIELDAPSRDIDEVTAVVTRVVATVHTSSFWVYTVVAEEADLVQADFLTEWRSLMGGGGSSAISVSAVSSAPGASGSGTSGKLAKWLGGTVLGDSIISESGSVATVAGTLDATALTVGGVAVITTAAIGSTVQAYDADLASIAGITFNSAGRFLRDTGSGVGISTLVLPNAATQYCIPYATAANTWGESASLKFQSSALLTPSVITKMADGSIQWTMQNGAGSNKFGWYLEASTNDLLLYSYSAGGPIQRISGSGLVSLFQTSAGGIGTPLFMGNSSNAAATRTFLAFAANTTTSAASNRYGYIGAYNESGSNNGTALVFGTNEPGSGPVERVRISEAGLVGVGTTSPGRLLDVNGATRFRDTMYFGASDERGLISWTSDMGDGDPGLLVQGASGYGLGLRTNNGTTSVRLAPSGAAKFLQGVSFSADASPVVNYVSNLGSLSKKYLTLHAAELWVETLVAQDVMATIGGRVVVAPTTTLTSDLTDVATSIVVKHNNLASGDRVRLESDGKVEWMAITSSASGSGPYTYSVTRDLDGSGANVWYAGDAVLNTGTTGDGFIDLYSTAGVLSGYGPTIVGNVRTGTTYSDIAARWAIGNLNGLYGYASDTYGAAFGVSSAANLTIDPTNGIRLRYGTTDKITLSPSGDASFTGTVTADAGTFGGVWQVNSNRIAYDTGTNATSAGMAPLDYPFYAGAIYSNRASAVFRVTPAGNVTATVGTIGGWTLGSTTLSGGNVTLDAAGVIKSGASDFATGTGWYMDYNSGTPRFRVGTASGSRMSWEGSAFHLQMGTVSITADGLYVQPANDAISLEDQQPYGYSFGSYYWGMFGREGDGPRTLSLYCQNPVNEGSYNTATVHIEALSDNGAASIDLVAPGTGGATGTATITAPTITLSGSVVVGSPTGGAKGTGTINATAVYDDNTLLSDWVFDLHFTGKTAARHAGRLYSMLETEEIARVERRLPWMPSAQSFDTDRSLGGMTTRLWAGQEQQQLYIFDLERQVTALSARVAQLEGARA